MKRPCPRQGRFAFGVGFSHMDIEYQTAKTDIRSMSRHHNITNLRAVAGAGMAVAIAALPMVAVAQTVESGKKPLSQVFEIREGLIATGIAYEISEVCPDIRARIVRGVFYFAELEQKARQMGYSKEEVSAFIADDVQKDALEEVARARLADLGAIPGDVASHCAVGAREIAAESQIGRLLR